MLPEHSFHHLCRDGVLSAVTEMKLGVRAADTELAGRKSDVVPECQTVLCQPRLWRAWLQSCTSKAFRGQSYFSFLFYFLNFFPSSVLKKHLDFSLACKALEWEIKSSFTFLFTAVKIAIPIKDKNEYFTNFKKLSELISTGLVLLVDSSHLVEHGVNSYTLFLWNTKHVLNTRNIPWFGSCC